MNFFFKYKSLALVFLLSCLALSACKSDAPEQVSQIPMRKRPIKNPPPVMQYPGAAGMQTNNMPGAMSGGQGFMPPSAQGYGQQPMAQSYGGVPQYGSSGRYQTFSGGYAHPKAPSEYGQPIPMQFPTAPSGGISGDLQIPEYGGTGASTGYQLPEGFTGQLQQSIQSLTNSLPKRSEFVRFEPMAAEYVMAAADIEEDYPDLISVPEVPQRMKEKELIKQESDLLIEMRDKIIKQRDIIHNEPMEEERDINGIMLPSESNAPEVIQQDENTTTIGEELTFEEEPEINGEVIEEDVDINEALEDVPVVKPDDGFIEKENEYINPSRYKERRDTGHRQDRQRKKNNVLEEVER